jgi:hypothetical protein
MMFRNIWALQDSLLLLTFSSYNTSRPLSPSSHEMRYNSFLGSMSPKMQKIRKQRGRSVESGKYEWKWYDDPFKKTP